MFLKVMDVLSLSTVRNLDESENERLVNLSAVL